MLHTKLVSTNNKGGSCACIPQLESPWSFPQVETMSSTMHAGMLQTHTVVTSDLYRASPWWGRCSKYCPSICLQGQHLTDQDTYLVRVRDLPVTCGQHSWCVYSLQLPGCNAATVIDASRSFSCQTAFCINHTLTNIALLGSHAGAVKLRQKSSDLLHDSMQPTTRGHETMASFLTCSSI